MITTQFVQNPFGRYINYSYFRMGAGAPMRDPDGNVVAARHKYFNPEGTMTDTFVNDTT
jgi:hypothetical protein